jgi:hypothetical protein
MSDWQSNTVLMVSLSPTTEEDNWTVRQQLSMHWENVLLLQLGRFPLLSMVGLGEALIYSKHLLLELASVSWEGCPFGGWLCVLSCSIPVWLADRRQHNGEAGVDLAIKLLMDEFQTTMALAGCVMSLPFWLEGLFELTEFQMQDSKRYLENSSLYSDAWRDLSQTLDQITNINFRLIIMSFN